MQYESAAAEKHHLGPIKIQIHVWEAYITAHLSNEIIVSNGIIGSVNQCLSLNILVDKDRGSVYMYGSFRNHGFGFGFGYSPAEALSTYTQSTLKM